MLIDSGCTLYVGCDSKNCSLLRPAQFLVHSISGFLVYSQVYLVGQGDERRILYIVSYFGSFSCRWGMANTVLLQGIPGIADMPCIPFVQYPTTSLQSSNSAIQKNFV